MTAIGPYLKNLREQKGLTTSKAQELSNGQISQSYIVQVENGSKTPSVAKLAAFAQVYGVSIHDLIDAMLGKEGKAPKPPLILSAPETRLIKHVRKIPEIKRKALMAFLLD